MSGSAPEKLRAALALGCACLLTALGALACASTNIAMQNQYAGALPRPQRILIFPFAASPDEVTLDWSPAVAGVWKLRGIAPTAEKLKLGDEVAQALAKKLVEKVQALGLPAELATGPAPAAPGETLAITGQFISISQGNRAERLVIGLGAGRSDVRTEVQVSELFPSGRRLVDQFEVDAKSGRKPGAAETMGMGAAAAHVATSAAITVAGSVASEEFGANVEADAERTASKIADALKTTFERQGWIPAGE